MPVDHYENFPVASFLLPKRLRRPVEIIYHFARQADDFADEGDMANEERLERLDTFRAELDRIKASEAPQMPLFAEIATIVAEFNLPLQLFHDLLDAFSQDVIKKRYANFDELLDYCRRSANPVGRLLLHLFEEAAPRNLEYSDDICTALQLINFWQDVKKDFAIGRIYLPQDEMAEFDVTEQHIAEGRVDKEWRNLMRLQCDRATAMMKRGAPLGSILTGRTGLEIRMVIAGGNRILAKLRGVNYDMFEHRPVLQKHDWVIMLLRSAPFSF